MSQVSYGSSSTIFSNRDEYPYFSRITPSDSDQVKAMIDLLKELNANDFNISSVQLLYSSGLYGRTAAVVSRFPKRTRKS